MMRGGASEARDPDLRERASAYGKGKFKIQNSVFLATLFSVVRLPYLALGGVQLPLPILQCSELAEGI